METKKVYQYDEKKYYKGELTLDSSDKSPSGAWNIPARCVEIEPLTEKEKNKIKWNGSGWEYEEIPKEPEPPEPTLDELKAAKHNEAGVVFAGKRDAIRQVTISDGNTYGFDTCSEDITNFMASWKAAEISEQTLYKVWQQDGSKGMIVMKLADFTTVFNFVRDSQYAAYDWYEQIVDKINAAQSKEELDAIVLE